MKMLLTMIDCDDLIGCSGLYIKEKKYTMGLWDCIKMVLDLY